MKHQDKRQAILACAEQVFNEKGLQAAKVEEIAKLAGIAKGTFYIYFKSKQEIFFAVLKGLLENYHAKIQCTVESSLAVESKLLEIIRQQLQEIPRLVAFAYPELTYLDAPLCDELVLAQEKAQSLLAQVVEQGIQEGKFRQVDSLHAAFCLIGILRAHVDMALLNRDAKWHSSQLPEAIYTLFVGGLRN